MKYVSSESLKWEYLSKNDIHVGRDKDLIVSDLLDIVHVRIEAGHKLPLHYHTRPQNGHEVFYFYKGGNFVLKEKDGQETTYDQLTPFYLVIGSGPDEAHAVTNLAKDTLEFICICAPKFEGPDEETRVQEN